MTHAQLWDFHGKYHKVRSNSTVCGSEQHIFWQHSVCSTMFQPVHAVLKHLGVSCRTVTTLWLGRNVWHFMGWNMVSPHGVACSPLPWAARKHTHIWSRDSRRRASPLGCHARRL